MPSMNLPRGARMDEELRSHLAAIVDSSYDAIISKDLDGFITSWNAGAQRIYGYTAEEAIGRPISMLVPADNADEIPSIMDRLRRGERVDHYEAVRQAKDGSLLTISLSVSPIRDGQGRVVGASAVGRDITEEKRIQELSRRLIRADDIGALYRELVDAAIEITGSDRGTMQALDIASGELWLLEARGMPEELRNRSARLRPGGATSCGEALRRGERVIVDYATGEGVAGTEDARTHLEAGIRAAQSTPLVTRSGRLVGMLSTHWEDSFRLEEHRWSMLDVLARQAADLIERMESEKTLRESERSARERADELAALLDSVPAAVFVAHDPEARRITGSRRAHELLRVPLEGNLSRSADEAQRLEHFRVLHGGVEVALEDLPVQRAARGEEMYDQELEIRFDDGTVRHLFGNAVPVLDDHGRVRGSIAAMIDITDRKEAEEALREADRHKDEFLAILGHELRNPLGPIRTAANLLPTVRDDPEHFAEVSAVIERQSATIAHLIDDLLDVSRIARGKIELREERIQLAPLIREEVEAVRSFCGEKRLELSVELPPAPLSVEGDRVRLAQILNPGYSRGAGREYDREG